MASPNRDAYDSSSIDWDRLGRYARRVAAETRLSRRPALTYASPSRGTVERTEQRKSGLFGLGKPKQVTVSTSGWVERTVTAVGPHWLLDRRRWLRVETTRNTDGSTVEETSLEYYHLVLLPQGALTMVCIQSAESLMMGSPHRSANGLIHREAKHSTWDPQEEDICRLDFENYSREIPHRNGNSKIQVSTNREPGKRLLKHAKGVGVNLALKSILEGRSPAS